MIDELISLQKRNLLQGKDILSQVQSWGEIKGSNNSIFEIELKDDKMFRETKEDHQLFDEIIRMNKEFGSPKLFILKEIVGKVALHEEINLLKTIRNSAKIPGLVYLISYAIYKTDALEVGYVLMERGDLNLQQFVDERVNEGVAITSKEFESIMNQTIIALAAMQEAKIAHNDIKPANILVFKKKKTQKNTFDSPSLKSIPIMSKDVFEHTFVMNKTESIEENNETEILIKICDIGSGQSNASTLKSVEQRGTLQYMAPEILQDLKGKINIYKQDVFSLGLCFIYVALRRTSCFHLSLRAPLKAILNQELALNLLNENLREWIRIIGLRIGNYRAIQTILSKMLSIDLQLRPDFLELKEIFNQLFEVQLKNDSQQSQNESQFQISGFNYQSTDLDKIQKTDFNYVTKKQQWRSPSDNVDSPSSNIKTPLQNKRQQMLLDSFQLQDSFETKFSTEEGRNSGQDSPQGLIAKQIQKSTLSHFKSQANSDNSQRETSVKQSQVDNQNNNYSTQQIERRKLTYSSKTKSVNYNLPIGEFQQSIVMGSDFKPNVSQQFYFDHIQNPNFQNAQSVHFTLSDNNYTPSQRQSNKQYTSADTPTQRQLIQLQTSRDTDSPSNYKIKLPPIDLSKNSPLINKSKNININTPSRSIHNQNSDLQNRNNNEQIQFHSRKNASSPQIQFPALNANTSSKNNESPSIYSQGSNKQERISGHLKSNTSNFSSQIQQRLITSFHDSESSNPSSPQLSSVRQNTNGNQKLGQINNLGNSTQKSQFSKTKVTFNAKQPINNQKKSSLNDNKLQQQPLLEQQCNSMATMNISSSTQLSVLNSNWNKSSRSLYEIGANEKLENVVVNDFKELTKFNENFQKISCKYNKHLTIIFSGNDKTTSYGMVDILQRLQSLKYLTLIFISQKREVINWAFNGLCQIEESLQNLQITLRDCDYSLANDQQNSQDTIALQPNQKQSLKEIILIIKIEGKTINSTEMVETLINRFTNTLKRLHGFSLELKKCQDCYLVFSHFLIALQKLSKVTMVGVGLCQSQLSQSDVQNIFTQFQSFQKLNYLSLNLSYTQASFENAFSIQFPTFLHTLHLSVCGTLLTSTEIVKLTKAIKSCQGLTNLELYLVSCFRKVHFNLKNTFLYYFFKNEASQLMLFLPDVFQQVKHVSVFADNNSLTDTDFNTYKSNLVQPFQLETLVFSMSKNILSFSSFQSKINKVKIILITFFEIVISQFIKIQPNIKKVIINFPRTFLRVQVENEFSVEPSRSFSIDSSNDDYETITIEIQISKKIEHRKSVKGLVPKPSEAKVPFSLCYNLHKDSPCFSGAFCITCFENYNILQNDSYFCTACIQSCHKNHRTRPILEFKSSYIVCKCKDISYNCETYKQLDKQVESLSPLKLSSPVIKWS